MKQLRSVIILTLLFISVSQAEEQSSTVWHAEPVMQKLWEDASFSMPTPAEVEEIKEGQQVRLLFLVPEGVEFKEETIWVKVIENEDGMFFSGEFEKSSKFQLGPKTGDKAVFDLTTIMAIK